MESDDEAVAIARPAIAAMEAHLGRGHPALVQARVLLADIQRQAGSSLGVAEKSCDPAICSPARPLAGGARGDAG